MDRRTKEVGALSYISTDAFNNNFFKYTVTTGPPPRFVKTGALTTVAGATSVNCPAGNILRENGKKLYPGAYDGVNTYMVGVFDILSNLSGYINPNDPVFALFNGDRPNYLKDSVNSLTKNLGAPVFTQGDVMCSGDIVTAGRLILNSGNTGFANMTSGTIQGLFRKLTVSADNCKSTSKIMLTYAGINNPGILSAEAIADGSFQVVSSSTTDAGVVMYLIIN